MFGIRAGLNPECEGLLFAVIDNNGKTLALRHGVAENGCYGAYVAD
jgi:hypothetical protein